MPAPFPEVLDPQVGDHQTRGCRVMNLGEDGLKDSEINVTVEAVK